MLGSPGCLRDLLPFTIGRWRIIVRESRSIFATTANVPPLLCSLSGKIEATVRLPCALEAFGGSDRLGAFAHQNLDIV